MKIVFLDSYTLNPGDLDWSPLEALGTTHYYDRTTSEQVLERSKGAQVLIANKVKLNREILSQLPELQCICIAATGYNNIDLDAANALNIRVMNVSGYSTASVAQHVFALLLGITNRVETYVATVKNGRWSGQKDFSYWDHSIMELAGKTMGIYGFGKIGQRVAKIALAFGMEVIAVHKHPERDRQAGVTFVSPDAFFHQADVISLHTPLTPDTHHLINKHRLVEMKDSALLINTGRGDLVNEKDLLVALQTGQIAGAALDVLSQEPPPADHPLFKISNCWITPHQAWASQASRQRLLIEICENISAFKRGERRNIVE